MALVTVVGGVNIDIGGRPSNAATLGDSNPGVVTTSLGGVGRNIAHNLALLGLNVRLLSVFGNDDHAERIRRSCQELGIDASLSLTVDGERTSTYLFITDVDGDMALAVNDMEIYRHLTPAALESRMDELNRSDAVVVDANIPQESIEYLAQHCTAPLFSDPVSVAKGGRLKTSLCKLHTLKPNRMEAELLSGVSITDEESLQKAVDALLNTGMQYIFLSLGRDGVLAAKAGERVKLPVFPTSICNTTGAGDAFMSAVVWSYVNQLSLTDAAKAGLAAASIAMESSQANNPALCEAALRQRAGL